MAQKIGFYFRCDFLIYQLFDGQADVFIGQMVAADKLANEFFEHVEQSKISRHESKVKMGGPVQHMIFQLVRKVCTPVEMTWTVADYSVTLWERLVSHLYTENFRRQNYGK